MPLDESEREKLLSLLDVVHDELVKDGPTDLGFAQNTVGHIERMITAAMARPQRVGELLEVRLATGQDAPRDGRSRVGTGGDIPGGQGLPASSESSDAGQASD